MIHLLALAQTICHQDTPSPQRRQPAWLVLSTCVALVGLSNHASVALSAETHQRPNIVLIMADDLGFETIGANGGTSYRTPVLDQMAAQGVRFEHCYAQPICTPTRVKLMTGIYNVRNYAKFGFLETQQRTFANILRDAGYKTCIVGKWQLGQDKNLPDHFGFDEHCLWQLFRRPSRYPSPGLEINGVAKDYKPGYGPDVVADYALNFIDQNKDQPFLLYYPMILTHCPFEPTPDSADWDPQSPGSKTYKGDAKYFGDMVTYMDKTVGRILDQLDQSGVRDNTLVLFTGDNGTDTPVVSMMGDIAVAGQKGQTTDGGTRVPLIAQWPGRTPKGNVCRDLVDFSDFLPTMCAAAKVDPPTSPPLDGQSFLPQLMGETGTPRDWIYIWYARNGGPTGKEFTRDQRYKLYRSGKFFDIASDRLEKKPMNKATLSDDAKTAHAKLLAALNQYTDARPERFANWKKNELKKAKPKKKENEAKR
ncbi:MAG: sulfatase-like hydrolase/transferase [Pirellulaceae bacterium]|nr:sulfatase-like hydrolase/transferase [Pirellulaceae bacterium]